MFDRRLFQYFDWWLMGLTLILCSIGLTIVYSAVTAGESDLQRVLWVKQGVWYAIGLTAMIVTFIVNYKVLDKLGGGIYAMLCFGTIQLPALRRTGRGSGRSAPEAA